MIVRVPHPTEEKLSEISRCFSGATLTISEIAGKVGPVSYGDLEYACERGLLEVVEGSTPRAYREAIASVFNVDAGVFYQEPTS